MKPWLPLMLTAVLILGGGGWFGWRLWDALADDGATDEGQERSVPVEVAPVERGPIERRRTYSGTLEAAASFRVAPKVGGRIERLAVDLADEVTNGQVVAELDDAEFAQAVAQAEAELAVAEARRVEARNTREIAERTLQRQSALRERGVASDAQYDAARAEQLAAEARVAVAGADVQRAASALETARIRLGYTQVRAAWTRGDSRRVVAERFADEGDTVAANTGLLTVVELDPIRGGLFVAERDYAALRPGQPVTLRTDAYPNEFFEGRIDRVAPVFESDSRQARVEIAVPNGEGKLKPGMFVRVEAVLERVEDAVVVPEVAVVRRDGRDVVFVIDQGGLAVRVRPVEVGITHAGRLQVLGEPFAGRVVTLGQQLLDDGSAVTIAGENGVADHADAAPVAGSGADPG